MSVQIREGMPDLRLNPNMPQDNMPVESFYIMCPGGALPARISKFPMNFLVGKVSSSVKK